MKVTNLKMGAHQGIGFSAALLLTACMTVTGARELDNVDQATDTVAKASYGMELAEEWLREFQVNVMRAITTATSDEDETQQYLGNQHSFDKQSVADTSTRDKGFLLRSSDTDDLKGSMNAYMIPATDRYGQSTNQLHAFQHRIFLAADTQVDAIYERGRKVLVALGVAAIALAAIGFCSLRLR